MEITEQQEAAILSPGNRRELGKSLMNSEDPPLRSEGIANILKSHFVGDLEA